ncbi:MAG: prephenate dehydratase domain-containing protein [Patescibacteria group bacterium]
MKIGVMGDKGSFSEEAAIKYAQENDIKNYEIKYLINADPVLKNLTSGAINIGIFPIQNNTGGIVEEAMYAVAKYNFEIKDIFNMDIRLCLMCKAGQAKEDIKKIVSHPQPLKQARNYLKDNYADAIQEEWKDTAKAAKDLANGELGDDVAIIASKRCAKIYGLQILHENIQDYKFNVTTFLAVVK